VRTAPLVHVGTQPEDSGATWRSELHGRTGGNGCILPQLHRNRRRDGGAVPSPACQPLRAQRLDVGRMGLVRLKRRTYGVREKPDMRNRTYIHGVSGTSCNWCQWRSTPDAADSGYVDIPPKVSHYWIPRRNGMWQTVRTMRFKMRTTQANRTSGS
jgi:hypothetical protein